MDLSQIAVVIGIVVVILLVAQATRRRGGVDGPANRGAYSSRAETTGTFAAMGAASSVAAPEPDRPEAELVDQPEADAPISAGGTWSDAGGSGGSANDDDDAGGGDDDD